MAQEDNLDAYGRMVDAFANAGAAEADKGAVHIYLGTVLSVAPFRLSIAGTVQDSSSVFVAAGLKSGYSRAASITGGSTLPIYAVDSDGNTTDSAQLGAGSVGKIKWTEAGFAIGDKLLCLSPDMQIFYAIERMVSP